MIRFWIGSDSPDPPVSMLKQPFLKIIILYQKRRLHQSNPIKSDPESYLDIVNGRFGELLALTQARSHLLRRGA